MNSVSMIAALVLAAAYGIGFFVLSYRSCTAPRGTTQWIREYDRPRFSMGTAVPFSWQELRFGLIAVGIAVVFNIAMLTVMGDLRWADGVSATATAALTAAAAYLLSWSMSGERLTAVLTASVLPLTAFLLGAHTVFLLLTALSLWLWMTGAPWWSLMIGAASLAVAAYFLPQLWLVGLPLLAVVAFCAWQRVETDRCSVAKAVGTVAMTVGVFVAVLILTYVPWAITAGLGFPQCFGEPVFWSSVASAVFPPELIPIYQGEVDIWLYLYGFLNLPCVSLTFAGAFASAYLLWRDRTGEALFTCVWCVSAMLMYLFSVEFTAVGAAAALSCFLPRLRRRQTLTVSVTASALPVLGVIASDIVFILFCYSYQI